MKKRVIIASVLPKKRGEAMKKLLAILLGFSLAFQFSAVHAFAAKAKPDPKAVHPAEAAFTDEGQKEFCSFADDLLQFRSEAHILGFKPDRVYMAGLGYVLIEEFVGTNGVTPVAAGSPEREDNLTQGAPELRKVSYPNLWQGITLHYEAKQGGLTQSTYIVEPEADVSTIRLRYNGEAKIQKDGTLRFRHPTEKGYFTMTAPIAWQEISGEKVDVEVSFNEYEDNAIGFEVGRYDRQYPLIIDPTYVWHTFHGSSSSDWGYGIATDTGGNIYVTGYSNATWGSPVNAHSGNSDIVVMKLSTDGALQWNTFHGSMSDDIGLAIAADGNGGVYVAGFSYNAWGSPVNAHAHSGHPNIVVLKLDTDGALQWNTFHGSAWDSAFGIVTDMSGNVYVTGYSNATWGSPVNAHTGSADIVVMKLSTDGALQWNTFHGAGGMDYGYGIVTDMNGNVYVTGYSEGTWGLPVNAHSGSTDIVVLKLDTDGALQWNTFHGANSWDEGRGIAVTGGNVYVAGNSEFGWGSPVNAHSGSADIVVLKLDTDGVLQWNTFHGSDAWDEGGGIAVTGGNVYVAGASNTTWGLPVNAHTGSADIVVLKLSPVTFADVPPGFWAYDYIMAIYDAGITTGYPDGTYRPSQNVQRSQMAAFIIRAKFGEDFSYSPTPHFSDVPSGHWAFKYVQKMYDEGITTGYADGTYRPSQNVSRAQMAAFIIRALFGDTFSYTLTPHFTDIPDTHWAFSFIQKMCDEGITTGYADGTYRPSQNVSRAQMATFIARAFLGME